MSIYDPHRVYVHRQKESHKGQVIQKKPRAISQAFTDNDLKKAEDVFKAYGIDPYPTPPPPPPPVWTPDHVQLYHTYNLILTGESKAKFFTDVDAKEHFSSTFYNEVKEYCDQFTNASYYLLIKGFEIYSHPTMTTQYVDSTNFWYKIDFNDIYFIQVPVYSNNYSTNQWNSIHPYNNGKLINVCQTNAYNINVNPLANYPSGVTGDPHYLSYLNISGPNNVKSYLDSTEVSYSINFISEASSQYSAYNPYIGTLAIRYDVIVDFTN